MQLVSIRSVALSLDADPRFTKGVVCGCGAAIAFSSSVDLMDAEEIPKVTAIIKRYQRLEAEADLNRPGRRKATQGERATIPPTQAPAAARTAAMRRAMAEYDVEQAKAGVKAERAAARKAAKEAERERAEATPESIKAKLKEKRAAARKFAKQEKLEQAEAAEVDRLVAEREQAMREAIREAGGRIAK
jgi:hypothetical protein